MVYSVETDLIIWQAVVAFSHGQLLLRKMDAMVSA